MDKKYTIKQLMNVVYKYYRNGGVRYNWIMPSFVGIANRIDPLYAIKRVVKENKIIA